MKLENRSIITGGAGFIGSHLVDTLLKKEHEIIVIDNFSTGRLQNIDHAKENMFTTKKIED